VSRKLWLNLLLTVVVAGLAGFAGAWAGSEVMHRQERTSLLRESVHALVQEHLRLTPEQQREIDAIEARYAKRRDDLRVQAGRANAELASAMSEEMAFGPKAQKAIDHLQASVGDLQSATVLYILEVRDVLTKEQRVVYDRKVVEALTHGVL
jgi:hypothetical protein